MSAAPAGPQAPQRVCPRCSSIARTVDPECPFCERSYTRRGPWAAVAAAVMLTVAGILAGVALMLTAFGAELETELDDSVDLVRTDIDRDVRRLERRIIRQLDERLPAAPATP